MRGLYTGAGRARHEVEVMCRGQAGPKFLHAPTREGAGSEVERDSRIARQLEAGRKVLSGYDQIEKKTTSRSALVA